MALRKFSPAPALRAAWRVAFYGLASGVLRDRPPAPLSAAARRTALGFLWEAFRLRHRWEADGELARALGQLERQDWADLPSFLWALPGDLRRLGGRRRGRPAAAVVPPDRFPYPRYYLHDFHHQKNGGLSRQAAATYEWQIRFLFAGTNRIMRHAVVERLPPGDHLRVLDLGCGTAAWLPQARLTGRHHRVVGVDLSAAYLEVARRRGDARAEFLQANAERLPPSFAGAFDRVVVIWLYHELPPRARAQVTRQIARALKPGGEVLFMDAAQAEDVPDQDIGPMNRAFADDFSEPHFASYQALDLAAHFTRAGLLPVERQRAFVSHVMRLVPRSAPPVAAGPGRHRGVGT